MTQRAGPRRFSLKSSWASLPIRGEADDKLAHAWAMRKAGRGQLAGPALLLLLALLLPKEQGEEESRGKSESEDDLPRSSSGKRTSGHVLQKQEGPEPHILNAPTQASPQGQPKGVTPTLFPRITVHSFYKWLCFCLL